MCMFFCISFYWLKRNPFSPFLLLCGFAIPIFLNKSVFAISIFQLFFYFLLLLAIMEWNRFFPDKFGVNKRRRTTVTSKLRSLGIDYGEEMQQIGSDEAPVIDSTIAEVSNNAIQQRLSQLESTVTALNQELSRLRASPGSKGAVSSNLHETDREVYLNVAGGRDGVAIA